MALVPNSPVELVVAVLPKPKPVEAGAAAVDVAPKLNPDEGC